MHFRSRLAAAAHGRWCFANVLAVKRTTLTVVCVCVCVLTEWGICNVTRSTVVTNVHTLRHKRSPCIFKTTLKIQPTWMIFGSQRRIVNKFQLEHVHHTWRLLGCTILRFLVLMIELYCFNLLPSKSECALSYFRRQSIDRAVLEFSPLCICLKVKIVAICRW